MNFVAFGARVSSLDGVPLPKSVTVQAFVSPTFTWLQVSNLMNN